MASGMFCHAVLGTSVEREVLGERVDSFFKGLKEICVCVFSYGLCVCVCVFESINRFSVLLGVQRQWSFEMMNTSIGLLAETSTHREKSFDGSPLHMWVCVHACARTCACVCLYTCMCLSDWILGYIYPKCILILILQ